MAESSIAIGYCHPAEVNATFHNALIMALNEDWRGKRIIKGRVIANLSGPMVDRARNEIVEHFLDHPDRPEWLLMVDADMVFSYEQIIRVLASAHPKDRPVVGGLCFAAGAGKVWPTLMQVTEYGIARLEDYPENALIQVDATGAAFLLIHRSVLRRMKAEMGEDHPAPWFAYSYLGKAPFGEDVTFCIRLMKMHIPLYVNTSVKIGHMKVTNVGEAEYRAYQATLPVAVPQLDPERPKESVVAP